VGSGSSAGTGRIRGERKLVSILFVDLTGYTALSARLDPEEVYRFLRPGLIALQRIVEDHGGTVPQIMGDGFMAVFGVPTTHEDDAERAVLAAVAVRDYVGTLNAGRRRIRFPAVHAGVNSGEVMVAPAEEVSGFAVIGDTVNTASRLADLASAGKLLVDERTRDRTVHAVRYGPGRALLAKGKPDPVTAYEALGARSGGPAGRRLSAKAFVDRRDVMERIREEVRSAGRGGASRVLLFVGEPGIGKSRLASQVRKLRMGTVLIGRCPAFGAQLPLHALAEALGASLGIAPGVAPATVEAAVRRLRPAIPSADRSAFSRDVRLLFGSEPVPKGQARGSVHDAGRAARVVLETLARDRPVIVILDDLHWADAPLVDLLRDAQRAPWPAPILFLALARPTPALKGLPRKALGLLGHADMRLLARDVLGPAVADAVLAEPLSRADGNPLFLEETLGMLVESGTLTERDGVWSVRDPEQLRRVPSTIRLLISARLDGLPEAEKRLLQEAAVAGDAVWDRLLEDMRRSTGSVDPADVRRSLASLERRELLVRRASSTVPDAVEYEFKHVLIREVAYESLPRAERALHHVLAAEWLRAQSGRFAEEPIASLAIHYERAWELGTSRTGPGPEPWIAAAAVGYLLRLADRTFAYQARAAEAIYARAVAVARSAGDGVIEPTIAATVLIGHAESLIEMGRHREAVADAAEARKMAERIGDRRLLARALLAQGRSESDLGRMKRARDVLVRAERLFSAEGDVRGHAWARHRISETWGAADYRRELDDLRASYRLFASARDRWGQSVAASDLAYLLTTDGGPEFERWYGRALRLADDEGDLRSRASLGRTAGYVAFYRGEYDEAIRVMEETQPLAARSGDRYAEADALLIRAMAESLTGSPSVARALAEDLLRIAREVQSARLRALAMLAEARAAVRSGDPALSERRLRAATRLVQQRRMVVIGPEVNVARAWTSLDRGVFSEVGSVAARVSAGARRNRWPLWEGLGPLLRGRALLGRGRIAGAERELTFAARSAGHAGATGTHALATLLIDECQAIAGRARTGRPRPVGGTEREAIAHEVRGIVATRAGRLDRAADAFDVAVERWELLGSTAWLARALALQAHVSRALGDRRAAATVDRRAARVLDTLRTPAREREALLHPLGMVEPPRRATPRSA
jgi:class 3 adenylate cyclase/tetratricopeptide (TPR) repeat protein